MSESTLERREAVRGLIENCGYAAAAVTILPIPGSELVAVMPIHVGMVVRIGDLYGVPIDRDSAMQLVLRIGATVGLSMLGSTLVTTATKFVLPGLGGIVRAPFMFASTLAIGRVAEAYFDQGELSDDQMRTLYRSSVKEAKRSFDPKKARSEEARQAAAEAKAESESESEQIDPTERLVRLNAMLEKGLISQEEYEQTKARILGRL